MDDLGYLLQLHKSGRLSDGALDAALKGLDGPTRRDDKPLRPPRKIDAPVRPPRARDTHPVPQPRKRKKTSDADLDALIDEILDGMPDPKPTSYTVELEVSLISKNAEDRLWRQSFRKSGIPLSDNEVGKYREITGPVPIEDERITELFSTMDELDWLELRGSLEPAIRVVSITGDLVQAAPLNWQRKTVTHGEKQPAVFSRYVDNTFPLWDSPNFRPHRCLASAFLGIFKEPLEKRRIKENPLLTYGGLWQLPKPGQPVPKDGDPMAFCWEDAVVWMQKWRLPGVAIDIHGRVILRYEPQRRNNHCKHLFAIMLHNNHVWVVNRNRDSFVHLYADKPPVSEPPPPRDTTTISDKWPFPGECDRDVIPVDSADGILGVLGAKNDALCITGEEPEDMIRDLCHRNAEPGALVCRNGVVDGFSVQVGTARVRVRRALPGDVVGDQPDDRTEWTKSRYIEVMTWIDRLCQEITPRNGLSHYSNDALQLFHRYRRGPRCGLLKGVPENLDCIGVDVARAYTSIMSKITVIPVLSEFDRLQGFSGDIKATAFYLVTVDKTDPILFPTKHDLIPGSTLEYADRAGIAYEVRGELVPHRSVKTEIGRLLSGLYASDLSDGDRKYVANLVYGLAGRRYNKAAFGTLYTDPDEAAAYSNMRLKTNLSDNLILVIDQVRRELSEGFRPVSRLILDGMRVVLHQMATVLGDSAVAVRTDCVYTTLSSNEARTALREAGFKFRQRGECTWDDVGSLRIDERSRLPQGLLTCDDRIHQIPVIGSAASRQQQIQMVNEFDDAESTMILEADALQPVTADDLEDYVAELLGEKDEIEGLVDELTGNGPAPRAGPLLVLGKYPGTGKTSYVTRYAERTGKKLLVVSPWNALCDEMKQNGFDAVTLHTLLGRRPEMAGGEKFAPYDVSSYDVILFDEVFLYRVRELEWMSRFVRRHRVTHMIIANGDPCQNEPVDQHLDVDLDSYYLEALANVFPRVLQLKIPKRYKDEDRARIMALYDELLLCPDNEAFKVARRHGLKVMKFGDLSDENAYDPHVAFFNNTVDRVVGWAHQKRGGTAEYREGDRLLGRKYSRVSGGKKLHSNAEYVVKMATETHMTVTGADRLDRTLTLASAPTLLRRPWCFTGHSAQGRTLGDRLFIHNANSRFATARWLRTAITRCKTLDISLVIQERRAIEDVR